MILSLPSPIKAIVSTTLFAVGKGHCIILECLQGITTIKTTNKCSPLMINIHTQSKHTFDQIRLHQELDKALADHCTVRSSPSSLISCPKRVVRPELHSFQLKPGIHMDNQMQLLLESLPVVFDEGPPSSRSLGCNPCRRSCLTCCVVLQDVSFRLEHARGMQAIAPGCYVLCW